VFAEDGTVKLAGTNGHPLEVISATYGYDASDLGDTQGSYALALQFGLLDEPLHSRAVKRLDELVVENGHHPTTGFWSSIELLLALSNSGYNEDAAEMLNQREQPSWGYMADHSTTFWEAFDARTRNLSLNHWTHSAVSEWLWRNVAGLNPDEQHPGYQSFMIHPRPTKEVTWCNASYDSIRGKISTTWKCEGDKFTLSVTIPANTTATVFIPASGPGVITESGKPAAQAEGVTFLRSESGAAVYQIGSGTYQFNSPMSLK
jgi:alpha-L-rhamnosidase